MNRNDVIDVLSKISSYDRRTIDEPDVLAWGEFFGSNPWITKDVAFEAVRRHFDVSDQWLKPAHVKQQARAARAAVEVAQARDNALTAAKPVVVNPMAFRKRDPARWDYLRGEGRRGSYLEQARHRATREGLDRTLAEDHAHAWADHVEDELAQGRAVPMFMPWPPTERSATHGQRNVA